MKLKTSKKTLSIAVGAALGAGMAFSPLTLADTNPFGATELSGGYMQIAEGSCGEGKCGGDKAKAHAEGSCGEGKADAEGSCGEGKADAEGSCGEGKAESEGSCGGDKSEG